MKFALRRVGYAVIVMFLASVVTFFALRAAPGNVTSSLLNPTTATPEQIAALEEHLGLHDPLIEQYGRFLGSLVTGQYGDSLVTRLPVGDVIGAALPYTLTLALVAFVLTFAIGIGAGAIAAINRDKLVDRVIRGAASVLVAVPNFVLAIILVLIFAVTWGILPVSGASQPLSILLPAIALAAEPAALTTRVTRTALLEQGGLDYVRALRARGITERRINWRHVLRNSLGPVVSLGAVQIRNLIGYALIVEVIFRWPGLGYQLVQSILTRDYAVAQVLSVLLALVVVISSALGDVVLRYVDPRVRLEMGARG